MWAGLCVCVRWGRTGGLSISSLGCSCLLTSLPQDSWEQLHGPRREREGERGGSLGHWSKPLSPSTFLCLLCFFLFLSPCVSLEQPQPFPEQTDRKTNFAQFNFGASHTHTAKNTAWRVDCSHNCGSVSLRCTQPTRITFYSLTLTHTYAHCTTCCIFTTQAHVHRASETDCGQTHLWSK